MERFRTKPRALLEVLTPCQAGSDCAKRLRSMVAWLSADDRLPDAPVLANYVGHPIDELEQEQVSDFYVVETAQLEVRIDQQIERQVFGLPESAMLPL